MTKDAKPDAARYLAFLTTTEANAVFERYGFRVLAKPTYAVKPHVGEQSYGLFYGQNCKV